MDKTDTDDTSHTLRELVIKTLVVVTIGTIVSKLTEKTYDSFVENRRNKSE